MADERVIPGKTHISNVQKHIARYNLALQYCPGVEVMDLACGSGYGTHLISKIAKWTYGYDIDSETVDYARSTYQGKNISFDVSDFYDVDKKVDTIVCFETIEHLEDLKKAQNKLLESLKPGGILIFSVPLNEEVGFNEHHKHLFTIKTARELFPTMIPMGELLQIGVNFFAVDENWDKPRTYYISVKKKPL